MKNIIDELDFLKKTIIQWNIRRKKIFYCLQLNEQGKIPDPTNTKQYYQSYLKGRNTKLVTRLTIIT